MSSVPNLSGNGVTNSLYHTVRWPGHPRLPFSVDDAVVDAVRTPVYNLVGRYVKGPCRDIYMLRIRLQQFTQSELVP